MPVVSTLMTQNIRVISGTFTAIRDRAARWDVARPCEAMSPRALDSPDASTDGRMVLLHNDAGLVDRRKRLAQALVDRHKPGIVATKLVMSGPGCLPYAVNVVPQPEISAAAQRRSVCGADRPGG